MSLLNANLALYLFLAWCAAAIVSAVRTFLHSRNGSY